MANTSNAAKMNECHFQHEPLDFHGQQNSIRLIQVEPHLSQDGLIQCRIDISRLPNSHPDELETPDDGDPHNYVGEDSSGEQPTAYWCLSYIWGTADEIRMIRLNGKLFPVRPNLWQFLNVARGCYSYELLWIDALCIDQSNTTERNHQVQSMGTIYSNADRVLAWLGDKPELYALLRSTNESRRARAILEYEATYLERRTARVLPSMEERRQHALLAYEGACWDTTFRDHSSLVDLDYNTGVAAYEFIDSSSQLERPPLRNSELSTGKAERLYEKFAQDEYWTRAWVTQEVILGKDVMVVVGEQEIGIRSIAQELRTAFSYLGQSGFEHFADLLFDKNDLKSWGLINLLHHFRDKRCEVRRDRLYSLLALCGEGKDLEVDYNIPEEELLVQVLELCKSSLCFCSAAIVARALGPWDTSVSEECEDREPFVELHLYAITSTSSTCVFCNSWTPFSWTKRQGLLFCLGTACPDTHGHLFWEFDDAGEKNSFTTLRGKIQLQSRRENKSKDLCIVGAGVDLIQSEWKSVYIVRFTVGSLIEILQEELLDGEPGLRSCGNLWLKAERRVLGQGRLRLCGKA